MDTISSRESNINYLPWLGVFAGGAALILVIVLFLKFSSVKNEIADLKALTTRIENVEGQIAQTNNAVQVANETRNGLYKVAQDTNAGFKTISDQLGDIKIRLDKVEAARVAPVRATTQTAGPTTGGAGTPPVPGGDAYLVKSGDTGGKIATATGFSIAQLEAVNPGIDWRRLHVGQKIVLPKK